MVAGEFVSNWSAPRRSIGNTSIGWPDSNRSGLRIANRHRPDAPRRGRNAQHAGLGPIGAV